MLEQKSVRKRWEDYQASKTFVFWACAGCIVATMIIGFTWGGWVTGSTAERMATQGATAIPGAGTISLRRAAGQHWRGRKSPSLAQPVSAFRGSWMRSRR